MEFSNSIPFANLCTIGKVNGFSSIAYETYLKQTIGSVGNRLHAPDCQDKPLTTRQETYKATCSPCSCSNCQMAMHQRLRASQHLYRLHNQYQIEDPEARECRYQEKRQMPTLLMPYSLWTERRS